MNIIHVEGENRGHVMAYTISTCGWCRKLKTILNDLGIEYYYLDVDRLSWVERSRIREEVRRWNPMGTYPTTVIDNRKVVIGPNEDELERVLGFESG